MKDGEEEQRMPPNSTQNLNAKLSLASTAGRRSGGLRPSFAAPAIQSSAPRIKIVGGARQYRGGYHLNV